MDTAQMRVILFKEGDLWIAQGLEYDICTQANDLKELYSRFEMTVRLESQEDGGLERIAKAPDHFFRKWEDRGSDAQPPHATTDNCQYGIAA